MARFRGTDKLHFVDNQRIHGNFYELMDACKADGAEEPTWHEETGFVVVTFPFNKLNGMKVKKEDDPQNVTHVTQNVTQSNRLECLK